MENSINNDAAARERTNSFGILLAALVVDLLAYPYFEDSAQGAFLGGLMSL